MKKVLLVLAAVFTLGLSTVTLDAEAAKRMGSGKSMGTQRQASQDKAPTTAAQPAATGAAPAAAAAAPSRSSWMGPIAGIAAGLGLAALASHLGFGDELASMVMMGLVAVAIMAAIGFFMRKRAAAQQSSTVGAGGLQPAHAGVGDNGNSAPAYKVSMPSASVATTGSAIGSAIGSGVGLSAPAGPAIPAGFDVSGFERNAKVNFIRLQAANDAGNLDDIRQFTTPEMFAELKLDIADRGAAPQKTEVVSIDAKVIEVDENTERYLVSVQFIGVIRVQDEMQDEPFAEIWNLMKSRTGSGGWVLSGIQQTS